MGIRASPQPAIVLQHYRGKRATVDGGFTESVKGKARFRRKDAAPIGVAVLRTVLLA